LTIGCDWSRLRFCFNRLLSMPNLLSRCCNSTGQKK
jgi:hypothetical protein